MHTTSLIAPRYGSLQHNTEPLIQASNLDDHAFKALIECHPDLQGLVELITINGHVIEKSYLRSDLKGSDLQELETKIGHFCWQRTAPLQPGSDNYKTNYYLIAHIHMLWSVNHLLASPVED